MSAPDQLGFTFQPQRQVWTVRDLVGAVRTHVEREYRDVWLDGEISNYRPAESGHLYFTLKDGDAQLRVVMFRSAARLLRFKPENGMQIMARGRVTIYDARGELQLSAEYLEPKGAGALQVAFEQLKAKLAAEGLFDTGRKRPVPLKPRTIGVVTSPRGAALQDVLNILRRRHAGVNVLIYPAQVQGDSAAQEIASGIRYFNRSKQADVIIVARGGGSIEDLWAFNDEGLARVIAGSALSVISAVGHETDFTIADFVADLRAPTPSAAAELVAESRHQLEERVGNLSARLARGLRYRLLMARQRLTELSRHGAFAGMRELLARRAQKVDDLSYRLVDSQRRQLHEYRRRLEIAAARVRAQDVRRTAALMRRDLQSRSTALQSAAVNIVRQHRAGLDRLDAALHALSPLAILERGYAVVFDEQGNVLRDAALAAPGSDIRARLAAGELTATVKKR